ncbi:MarP family serine protease, partial [Streptomyces sp. NPDC059853]|uniref:MarP family serine protease n=1 Tax=Streptomyces sp. NPDC059853 TaxID=3346973 RepID=UPI003656E133
AVTTLPTLGREVRSSRVLLGVERVMPLDASGWMNDFSAILAQHGLPQVFSPFATEPITEVDPPDPALAGSPVIERAAASIVRVSGTAPSCGKVLEGSGFVFAQDKVMTNAHVVGGVGEPTVQIRGEGRLYDGRVVLYDWESDVAVLDVPGLDAPALEFSDRDALTGDDAIVAGFPESGPFDVRPARVRERFTANGPDIYRRGTVNRDVYSLYSTVRQGNSGGPLLTPEGEVYGLVFAKSLDDDSTGYALTLDEIEDVIERGSGATQPVDTQNCAM